MLSLIIVAVITQSPPDPSARPRVPAATFREQSEKCRALLKTSVVDFFLPDGVDREKGGYFESFRDGRFANNGEKFLVMQARQLWFFSTMATAKIETEASLGAAQRGYRFLQHSMHDRTHGGYFATVTDDGAPKDDRKHVYLNSFALYGLVAYHNATGDAEALDAAKRLFRVLDEKAHDARSGGYTEFFRRDWTPITDPGEPGFVGAIGVKTYNTHLHLLESFTELYRIWPDPVLRSRLTELLAIATLTVRLPSVGCNVDAWHPNWRVVDSPSNLKASYGHDVECAWLAIEAAEALGLPRATLRSWAESLCEYSMKFGYDKHHGGFFYTGPLGKPADDTRKEWWVQAEALVGMLTLYEQTGRPEFLSAFTKTMEFVETFQIRPEGGWFATTQGDGSARIPTLVSPWQGAYHSGRALLHSAEILDRLAKAAP